MVILFASIILSFMFVGAVVIAAELVQAYSYRRIVKERLTDRRHPLRNGANTRILVDWILLFQVTMLFGMLTVRVVADPIDFTRPVEWFRVGLFSALVISSWLVPHIMSKSRERDELWHKLPNLGGAIK